LLEITKIKKEIEKLPQQEYNNLRQWFAENDWKLWDKQMLEDSKSGELDFLIKEALQDKRNNN